MIQMIQTSLAAPHRGRVMPKLMSTAGLPMLVLIVVGTVALWTKHTNAAELKRIPWNDSKVVGYPDPPLPYHVVRTYEKLSPKQPVYVRAEPGTDRMFLIDHKGSHSGPGGLHVFQDRNDADSIQPLLELDRLVYGFCFHPGYLTNGHIFLMSNGPQKAENKQDRITRYTIDRTPNGGVVEGSEVVILEWDSNGHNGGDLAFGPDGMLYCPTGDGTSDSDTLETGQGLNDLLAVMLRLDVDHPADGKQYSVPADNPFVNIPDARPEIWAYGFRNPWRMDYDHQSDQLWVGQNGQDLWEQVYLVRKGENYGWSVNEGSHPFYLQRPTGPQPISMPTAEHHHSESRSLTGGIVYRGTQFPELDGAFIYGDYSTGKIWGVKHDGTQVTFQRELADTTLQITCFAMNHAGELLVVDHAGGFYRLELTPPSEPSHFPRKLSDTGLFSSIPDHQLHEAAMPYSVNAQLWSDGAHKVRAMLIPGEEKIEYAATRGWTPPNGSVLVKSFALEREAGHPETRRWIETRLMVRQQNEWVGYSYRWNDEQTDAVLLESPGADIEFEIRDPSSVDGVRRQTWHYPSRAECMVCHSRAANYVLGLSEVQMNRLHDYPDGPMNQIDRLNELGFFAKPLPKPTTEMPKLADPFDETIPLDTRARSYLHANCANCHIDAGGGNSAFAIEIQTPDDKSKLFDVRPVHTPFGIADAKVVASGDPDKSLLLYRLARRGHGQMPPMSTNVVDTKAVELIQQWIRERIPAPAPATDPSKTE